MTGLDNFRTHYCPDSGFSLISENDVEFDICNCFRSSVGTTSGASVVSAEADIVRSSPVVAEQIWYRTIAALAKVCGTAKPVQVESPAEHENEATLVRVRKA